MPQKPISPTYYLKHRLFTGPNCLRNLLLLYIVLALWSILQLQPNEPFPIFDNAWDQFAHDSYYTIAPVIAPLPIMFGIYLISRRASSKSVGKLSIFLSWAVFDLAVIVFIYSIVAKSPLYNQITTNLPWYIWPIIYLLYTTVANGLYRRKIYQKKTPTSEV